MLWSSDNGMCGAAVVLNAVYSIRGRVVVHYCQKLREMLPVLDNLSIMTEVFHQIKFLVPSHLYARVHLQSLKMSEHS